MVGAVGEMASMKRRKLWKTEEDELCCSSGAIQTWLGPSSLLEERSKIPIFFFVCAVGYPPNWGKWPRYIETKLLNYVAVVEPRLCLVRCCNEGGGPVNFSSEKR